MLKKSASMIPLACALVIVLSSIPGAFGAQPIDPNALRTFLYKGFTDGMSVLDDCRVLTKSEDWRDFSGPDGAAPDTKGEITYARSEYIRKGAKERFSREYKNDHHPEGRCTIRIFDGNYSLEYLSAGTWTDPSAHKGTALLLPDPDSPGIASRYPAGSPTGFMEDFTPKEILSRSDTIVDTQPRQVDGLSCYLVRANKEINRVKYQVSCWLSPDRSFLPVKMELHEQDGSLALRLNVTEFTQLPNGAWFLKKLVREGFWKTKSGEQWHVSTDKVTFEEIELNPQVDEAVVFNTSPDSLPVGTRLQDHTTGLEYVIGEGPVSDESIRNIIDRTLRDFPIANRRPPVNFPGAPNVAPNDLSPIPLLSDSGVLASPQSPQAPRAKTSATAVMVAVACASLIAAVAIFLYCKHRPKRTPS